MAIVNAAGPWVNKVASLAKNQSKFESKLVKGSHIVVPKFYEGEQGYILQNKDRRVIFVIPYHNLYTMIGTTDVAFTDDPNHVLIDDNEIDYLCQSVNNYFHHSIKKEDIISTWSGVRTLINQESSSLSSLSREYQLELLTPNNLPFINIFGGKITTYRSLAENVMDLLSPYFKLSPEWTATAPLPGGHLNAESFKDFQATLQAAYPFIPNGMIARFAKSYGSNAYQLLENCQAIEDLGESFGHGLYQKEVDYLMQHEWATTPEDILWRRTKLGLIFTKSATEKLEQYLA